MPEENVSKSLFEANAAINAQEFANRQILLSGNGVPTSPAPLGAKYIDKSTDPVTTYYQMSVGVGSQWETNKQGGLGKSGAVFITDIVPQDVQKNVGQKVFSSDGNVLDSAFTNTNLVRVSIVAAIGHTNYKPQITVKGSPVSVTQNTEKTFWSGSIDIDLEGDTTLEAKHEDGASHIISLTADQGAEITSAQFDGKYPATQTEVKRDDLFNVQVTSDSAMVRIEVEDYGAAQAQVFNFDATQDETIAIKIADRGEGIKAFGIRLRAMNANGSFGAYFSTEDSGSSDGIDVVQLNNEYPAGIIDAIQYPVGQVALKDNEQAQVDLEGSGYDAILYESPNGELQIDDPDVFEVFKGVSRVGGEYNISEPNIRITLTKASNGAVTIADGIVQIADADPEIRVTEPATRLRSGGNNGTQAQNHEITLSSNQELIEEPTITAPHGTLIAQMLDSGNKKDWVQTLRVHDDDQKGIFSFGLTSAKNLAGKTVASLTGDNLYELGGFVSRTLTVPAFQNELSIGADVAETSKVVARDKNSILLTYKNNLIDELKSYSITAPTLTLNVKGNLLYWADQQAVNNNTTGLATILIEEVV